MIKFIKSNEISNVRYIPQFVNDISIIVEKDSKELLAYNKKFEIIWRVNKKLYSCLIVENIIVPDLLALYDLKGGLIYSIQKPEDYNRENIFYESLTLWKTVDANDDVLFHVFDIQKKEFLKKNIPLNYQPVAFMNHNLLLAKMSATIVLYNISSNTPLWQADLSELCGYEDWQGKHQGEIANVYVADDKVLVNAGPFVFCFALETGGLLWQLKSAEGKFYSMVIDHGVAYLTYWRHYAEIDINKGIFLIEKEIVDFEYRHKKIFFQAKGTPVYHKGLIWMTLYTGGIPFIAALLPEKGEIIWVQHIASSHSINAPKFHNNHMYILDTGGTLHIFEEENVNP